MDSVDWNTGMEWYIDSDHHNVIGSLCLPPVHVCHASCAPTNDTCNSYPSCIEDFSPDVNGMVDVVAEQQEGKRRRHWTDPL